MKTLPLYPRFFVMLSGIIFLFFVSCTDGSKNIANLPPDLKNFILQNTDDLYSTVPVFVRRNGESYPLDFDTVQNEIELSNIIERENLLFTSQSINEKEFMQDPNIFYNVARALQLKKENPWNISIPDSIAANYLLPYKILFEKNGPWQKIFQENFGSILSAVPNKKLSKKEIDSLIENNVIRLDTGHIFTGREGKYRICTWPGISEIMMEKSGDCQSESIKNVYLYRSLGIPAAIDFTPFYGGGNAGHSTAVSWNNDIQKFRPKAGQGFNPDYRVSKAFRWSFKKSNIWETGIVPYLKSDLLFPIPELQNNHWIDVTEDHAHVKDISLNIPAANGKIAFIFTYSYGQWRPIFYGTKLEKNNFLFKKMAVDVLYRAGYYDSKGRINLESTVFILERDGKLNIINNEKLVSKPSKVKISLERNNYGSEAWVKQNRSYSLLGLNTNGSWDTIYTQIAKRDSLINFPEFKSKHQIFALMEHAANRRLERPFHIVKDSVVWY
ncbi:hypothetical protein [Sphingobacterium anhuiense]|uniref:hypothetical protein n=1 Tax=Sphingobacterium anhuiense TaxID=493780 RepID=UPI003C2D9D63